MLKKLYSIIILFFITFQICFALSPYRNESKVLFYKSYIEEKASNIIAEKTLGEKMDLLLRVQTLLTSYERRNNLEGKENFMNLLYALEEYIEESISGKVTSQNNKIIITVIDDARCNDCYTSSIVEQLGAMDFLSGATYVYKDFSDIEAQDYLIKNDISHLPAIVFSTNRIDDNSQITPFLQELQNGEYSLNIGSQHDPFIERSERGFLVLEQDVLDEILNDSYVLGNKNTEIIWLEYSDIECPYCAKLHNDGTLSAAQEEFGDALSFVFQHFPLDFHVNAKDASMALECIGDLYGAQVFYDMIEASFYEMGRNNFSFSTFYDVAEERGLNSQSISTCVSDEIFLEKVEYQMQRGVEQFGIGGTPGNVLINTKTGEYEIIGGAYPYESFQEMIESLLR